MKIETTNCYCPEVTLVFRNLIKRVSIIFFYEYYESSLLQKILLVYCITIRNKLWSIFQIISNLLHHFCFFDLFLDINILFSTMPPCLDRKLEQ